MNKRRLVLAALYMFLAPVITILVGTSIVHAEAPHCFTKNSDQSGAFREVDCGSDAIKLGFMMSNVQPPTPQDDKCYTATASMGGPMGGGFSIETRAFQTPPDSGPHPKIPDCQEWLTEAGVTSSSPAKCVVIDGSLSDWDAGKIKDLTKLHPGATCTDYTEKLKASGQIQDFQSGNCYLIFNDNGKYIAQGSTCGLALQELISRQQKSTTPNGQLNTVSRNDVANCGANGETVDACFQKNPIVNLLDMAVNFLAAGIGVIVVVMIIIGGIQYTSAGNNPQTVAAARKKITNAVIAFVAFLLVYAFMQWLIPGGIF